MYIFHLMAKHCCFNTVARVGKCGVKLRRARAIYEPKGLWKGGNNLLVITICRWEISASLSYWKTGSTRWMWISLEQNEIWHAITLLMGGSAAFVVLWSDLADSWPVPWLDVCLTHICQAQTGPPAIHLCFCFCCHAISYSNKYGWPALMLRYLLAPNAALLRRDSWSHDLGCKRYGISCKSL